MTTHVNFYENLTEAQMRLRNTIVMYDGEPQYVIAIVNHMKDGIFRIYLQNPKDRKARLNASEPLYTLMVGMENFNHEDPALGKFIDELITKNRSLNIQRKKMNSPLFNKFRPFPLGMVNVGEDKEIMPPIHGRCYYVERQPTRAREQGLTANACNESHVTLGNSNTGPRLGLNALNMFSGCFDDMIRRRYPSAREAYEALTDPDVTNEAIAFNENFALVRGPVDTMFLGYKDKIIGQVNGTKDLLDIRLGAKSKQLKEVTEETGAFARVA